MTTKFETYINLEDFKKKYLLDFSEDDRYDDFILYLKDLREYLHEFAYHIIEGKYDYFTDNSGLDFDDVVSAIIPNKTLLNVYLQEDEFKDIDFLDLDSQRFNIVGQNHDVFYTFWHLNILDIVEYIDNEILKISIIGGDVIKKTQKQSTQKATTFELPFYETLSEFKEYYLDTIAGSNLSKISLLRQYEKVYNDKIEITAYHSLPPEKYFMDIEIDNYFNDSELFELEQRFIKGENYYPDNLSKELKDCIDKVKKQYDDLLQIRETQIEKNDIYISIKSFIKDEIESEKINLIRFQGTTQKEIAEPANITHSTHEYTDEKTQNKYSVPQKIKILDMLNIKGWLMDKHNFTTFQIEELLSDLFDRTDKTIRNSFSDSKHENTAQQYLEELKKVKAKR